MPGATLLFMSLDWQAARRALARRLLRAPRFVQGDAAVAAAAVTRVLVARPNHRLGNVLLLTPLLQEIERLLPQAQVDVLAGPPFAAGLLRGYPQVCRVDTLPVRPLHEPAVLWRLWWGLPRRGYTLALDAAERSQSSRWAVVRSGARWRAGVAEAARDGGLTHPVSPASCGMHQAQMPVRMLRVALGVPPEAPVAPLAVRLDAAERAQGGARLDAWLGAARAGSPRIALFAEATGAKRYDEAFWRALVVALRRRQPHAGLAEIIPAHGEPLLPMLSGLHTVPLRELAALCAAFDLVIAADSGLMHLAAASGVPLLGLFQATDPARYGPCGERQRALDTRALDADAVAAAACALLR